MLQRLAVEKLHHDERLARVFADVVNRADVRGDSARTRPAPLFGTAPTPARPSTIHAAKTSAPLVVPAARPRPRTPLPCRRHPTSAQFCNGIPSDQSQGEHPPRRHLRCPQPAKSITRSLHVPYMLSKLLRNVPFLTSIKMSPFFVLYLFLLRSAVARKFLLQDSPGTTILGSVGLRDPVFPLELHPYIWVICVRQLVVITSEWPVTRGQPHPVTQMITATLHRTDRLPQLEIRYFSSGSQ